MNRKFANAKLRMNTISEAFPKGKSFLFANVVEGASNESILAFYRGFEALVDAKVMSALISNTEEFTIE